LKKKDAIGGSGGLGNKKCLQTPKSHTPLPPPLIYFSGTTLNNS